MSDGVHNFWHGWSSFWLAISVTNFEYGVWLNWK